MKKTLISLLIIVSFFSSAQISLSQVFLGRELNYVTGSQVHYFKGDYIGLGANTWYFKYEIAQSSWDQADTGIGKNVDGVTGWIWQPALWYEDGPDPNKRVQTNIANHQFTSEGIWYVVGRAKANPNDLYTYTDENFFSSDTNLYANPSSGNCPYFEVYNLNNPQNITASFTGSTVDLNWESYSRIISNSIVDFPVMIVRYPLNPNTNIIQPTDGHVYQVNEMIGTGTVVMTSTTTNTFTDTVDPNENYQYVLYSVNNNHYGVWMQPQNNNFINVYKTAYWNNTINPSYVEWFPGPPNANVNAVVETDFENNIGFTAKTLTINSGVQFKPTNWNQDIIVTEKIINNGTIILEPAYDILQTNSGVDANVNNGTCIVKRPSNGVYRLDYVAWSSPVFGQNLQSFSPDTLSNRFYTYNNGNYVQVPSPSTTDFSPGLGYQIRTPNNFPEYNSGNYPAYMSGEFTGTKLNNGDFTIDTSGILGNYVFLGNPYSSNLDAEAFYAANQNAMGGTFYIWDSSAKMDANLQYTGTLYKVYNQTGNIPATAYTNGVISRGQGFLVDKKANATTTNFVFNNAMRTSAFTNFSKSTVKNRIWVKLTSPLSTNSEMLIGYAGGTTGYEEQYDAKMLNNTSDMLYSTVAGNKLVIDGRGTFNINDEIPVSVKALQSGIYTISLAKKEGVFDGSQSVYIKDNQTGVITEITNGTYQFSANAGENHNRLKVLYVQNALGTSEQNGITDIKIYANEQAVNISSPIKIAKVEVFDMSIRKIVSKQNIGKNSVELSVGDAKIVLVSVELEDGKIVTKKIKL